LTSDDFILLKETRNEIIRLENKIHSRYHEILFMKERNAHISKEKKSYQSDYTPRINTLQNELDSAKHENIPAIEKLDEEIQENTIKISKKDGFWGPGFLIGFILFGIIMGGVKELHPSAEYTCADGTVIDTTQDQHPECSEWSDEDLFGMVMVSASEAATCASGLFCCSYILIMGAFLNDEAQKSRISELKNLNREMNTQVTSLEEEIFNLKLEQNELENLEKEEMNNSKLLSEYLDELSILNAEMNERWSEIKHLVPKESL
jgi:uncharacterized protein YlxW (UPF0749 family)